MHLCPACRRCVTCFNCLRNAFFFPDKPAVYVFESVNLLQWDTDVFALCFNTISSDVLPSSLLGEVASKRESKCVFKYAKPFETFSEWRNLAGRGLFTFMKLPLSHICHCCCQLKQHLQKPSPFTFLMNSLFFHPSDMYDLLISERSIGESFLMNQIL